MRNFIFCTIHARLDGEACRTHGCWKIHILSKNMKGVTAIRVT